MRFEQFSHLACSVKGDRTFAFAGLFAAALLLPGCAEKKINAPRPWQAAVNVRPILPAPVPAPADRTAAAEESAPDLPWDFVPPASNLSVPRQPVRPRVSVQQPAEAGDVQKPAAPSLAPQLSEQEIAAAQSQMSDSVAIAQKNLDAAKGRTLNPTQTDLASKVTSFLQESKDAVREGDWTRARNLAKKAQLLSEELAASL
jgi:hypothetical protein